MHSHPMARLTPLSRERLISRHLDERHPLKALAAEAGFSLRTATSGWLDTAQVVTPLWRIDGVFAVPSGGRSIRSNC